MKAIKVTSLKAIQLWWKNGTPYINGNSNTKYGNTFPFRLLINIIKLGGTWGTKKPYNLN